VDVAKTVGELRFSDLRRENMVQGEDGLPTDVVERRTYDLRSKVQGQMIQVSIPGNIPLRKFPYGTEAELVNPVFDTVSNATFQGADVNWYIKADDIVAKGKHPNTNKPNNQQGQPEQDKK